jgi:hypothetical protein
MRSMMECHGVLLGVGTDRESAGSSRRNITMGTMMTALRRRQYQVWRCNKRPRKTAGRAEFAWQQTAFHPPVVLACRARSSRLRLLLSCRKLTQLDTTAAPLTSSLSFVTARSLTTTTTRIHTSLHRISAIVIITAHGKHCQ